ncbi:Putative B3 domain-containing protein At5g35780 [Linum grandiflorum]
MKAREGGGNKVVGMKVKLVDPSLKVREITFKIWSMPKKNGTVSCSCVLTAPWNDVVKENRLVEGDGVQLWGFRMDRELGLGLFRVDGEGRVCCP